MFRVSLDNSDSLTSCCDNVNQISNQLLTIAHNPGSQTRLYWSYSTLSPSRCQKLLILTTWLTDLYSENPAQNFSLEPVVRIPSSGQEAGERRERIQFEGGREYPGFDLYSPASLSAGPVRPDQGRYSGLLQSKVSLRTWSSWPVRQWWSAVLSGICWPHQRSRTRLDYCFELLAAKLIPGLVDRVSCYCRLPTQAGGCHLCERWHWGVATLAGWAGGCWWGVWWGWWWC